MSFWIPGFFGSLAAVPQQAPGWSVTSVYYHTSVSAGGDVARAREITIGRFAANLTATVNANVNASELGRFRVKGAPQRYRNQVDGGNA